MVSTLLCGNVNCNDVNASNSGAAGSSSPVATAVSQRACRCCGDDIAPSGQSRRYCRECHMELAFGIFSDYSAGVSDVRLAAYAADRQYHGNQFHTAEW